MPCWACARDRRRNAERRFVVIEDWGAMTRDYSAELRELRAALPDVMKGFSATAQAALKANALDAKTKELLALGISVAIRCDPCVGFHAEGAVKAGASRAEILETIGTAIYMGAGPSVMYAAKALEAFDQFVDAKQAT
jgi:AhpD family alkylhydroperoxidase